MKTYMCFYCWDRIQLSETKVKEVDGFHCPYCGYWNELEEDE